MKNTNDFSLSYFPCSTFLYSNIPSTKGDNWFIKVKYKKSPHEEYTLSVNKNRTAEISILKKTQPYKKVLPYFLSPL